MAKSSTARRLDEPLAGVEQKQPAFGGGEPPAPLVRPNAPVGSNATLAVAMFLGAEAMFFAGLIGAYIVFRVAAPIWLLTVFVLTQQGRFSKEHHVGLQTCCMYWTFVVGLWPVLYGLIYLY